MPPKFPVESLQFFSRHKRRRQSSTLFPYTTLFRSPRVPRPIEPRCVRAEAGDTGDEESHRGDRKSTRLNSSHTVISYAVFCLKKKTRAVLTIELSAQFHSRLGSLSTLTRQPSQ